MIAIKDLEMPSSCLSCNMQIDGHSAGDYCAITKRELYGNYRLEHRHRNCPLVEIEERKGKWIRKPIRNDKGGCIGAEMICSCCNKDNRHDEYMDFCPNCGAKMEGEGNNVD